MFGWNLNEVSLPAFILNLEAFRAGLFSVSRVDLCLSLQTPVFWEMLRPAKLQHMWLQQIDTRNGLWMGHGQGNGSVVLSKEWGPGTPGLPGDTVMALVNFWLVLHSLMETHGNRLTSFGKHFENYLSTCCSWFLFSFSLFQKCNCTQLDNEDCINLWNSQCYILSWLLRTF